ncbi:ASI1-immunoprecipitated protein 2 isoform X3 [Daucus carota subsp. sativus]|uniref:ASI1-immunoprecipitated protein 2 isoform X3 n=1 Tax=Daucus carota subsp. sativus TaxID=79200 RepID=UPI0007EF0C5E|nr:PREDICTED: uncharacterized protein LOC108227421 isoform X2 [Daucus carota subsp. sativus]
MVKRKERIVTDLYSGTPNPQGVTSQPNKGIHRHTLDQNINVKVDPGTCNVCFAPCSSCLHTNRTRMEPKNAEYLDETSRESAISYSVDDTVETKKSRGRKSSQHTASEEDTEVPNKLLYGGPVKEKLHTPSPPKKDLDDGNSMSNLVDMRGLEGHDDNISCVSGSDEASNMSNSNKEITDTKALTFAGSPSSLASEDYIKAGQSQEASFMDKHKLEVQNKSSGEVLSRAVSGQKSALYASCDIQENIIGHVGGNSEPSAIECLKVEAEYNRVEFPSKLLISLEEKKEVEKDSELLALPEARETSMHSDPVNESDESDILEHDIKVCDICGDAGREELLAVCCSCSEGAEHTYCMKEMMTKLPEGDWLCEDCKFEKREREEKAKYNLVDGDGVAQKNADLGNLDGLHTDANIIKAEKESLHGKIYRKRKADDTEVSSSAKRQVFESTIRSPKISSPRRADVLSRDSSFKNSDRGKVKPASQIPPGVQTGKSIPEVANPSLDARQSTSRGTFLRSKSFSSASAKQKVKHIDEVVPQKHKSNRDNASLGTKGGGSRTMGKSMSFHAFNSGGSNSTDLKAKMFSPKYSHGQDIKGQNTKERSLVERKNSLRLERPLVNSVVTTSTTLSPEVDRNLPVRDKTGPFCSTSNNRDVKSAQSDNKLIQVSRPVNKAISNGSDVPVLSGEGTKQLSASRNDNDEGKTVNAKTKVDCSSTSLSIEGPISKSSESLPDGLNKTRVSTNMVESARGNSNTQLKHSTAGEKFTLCQKCKEVGHSAEFCTIDSPEKSLVPDLHTSRSSKDLIHKDNKLKAAIEAALLKKPGLYRKKRTTDHFDELTVSGINSEVCSQDQQTNTRILRKSVSGDEVSMEAASAWNTNTEFVKQATGADVKQLTNSAEAVTALLHWPLPPATVKSVMDLPSNSHMSISDLPITLAIPKHEYIWQGCFEVCRSGKQPGCYDGFQAHLSAGASLKVLETINKFPSTVVLNELPRHSVWPIQFEENGVKEEHIALYFFARDHESYEKSYKSILESMIRNDLALKGNIDGVEILIFPSNQLPVKYQRWNAMFFFWGVLKGKRNSCLQKVPVSPKKTAGSRDTGTANMSSSLVPVDKDSPTFKKAGKTISDVHPMIDLQCSPLTKKNNGNIDGKSVSHSQQSDCVNATKEQQGCRLDCNSVPTDEIKPPESWEDTGSRTNSLERQVDKDSAIKVARSACDSNSSDDKETGHLSTPYDLHHLPQINSKVAAGEQDPASSRILGEVDNEEKLRMGNSGTEGFFEAETVAEKVTPKLPSHKEPYSRPSTCTKQLNIDSLVSKSEASIFGSSQALHVNDRDSIFDTGGIVNKKPRLDYNDLYDLNDHTSSSRDSLLMQDSVTSFPVLKKHEEGSDETSVRTLENAERYFFPVDPYHAQHLGLGDSSVLQKRRLSENVEEFFQDKIPNLELALGAEMKLPVKQSLPHFLASEIEKNNQSQPPGKLPVKQSFPHFLAAQIEKNSQDQPPGRTFTTAEEDASAALSLSLAFPFTDKAQAGRPVETKELLPTERQHEVNFLKGFLDK